MVFDTFPNTQTLCRSDRNRNTTCCFSDSACFNPFQEFLEHDASSPTFSYFQ